MIICVNDNGVVDFFHGADFFVVPAVLYKEI